MAMPADDTEDDGSAVATRHEEPYELRTELRPGK